MFLLQLMLPFHSPASTLERRAGDGESSIHVETDRRLVVLVHVEDDATSGGLPLDVLEQRAPDPVVSDLRVHDEEVHLRLGWSLLVSHACEAHDDTVELRDADPSLRVRLLRAEAIVAERSRRW